MGLAIFDGFRTDYVQDSYSLYGNSRQSGGGSGIGLGWLLQVFDRVGHRDPFGGIW